ncbi:MAG: D-alanyl-D-alanine carboxypeptidase [Clostridia bacterium]|nr:D-alanyl-D-alanine carboxypeptidase [Clostridia bacterium]
MKFKKIILYVTLFLLLYPSITVANTNETPNINSRAAIVLDRATKKILYGKNENEVRKMASTTKIMTAIVVLENSNLYDTVTISKNAALTGGSTLGIKEGDKITVCDLLYGLLLKSGNDTAVALAEHVGGSIEGFAEIMNKKSQELGLINTHFVTPHGLDNDNHFTTAYELALLTDYALNNQTFLNFVSTKNYAVTINGTQKPINNTNELLGNLNGVYGVKTGFTNGANRCLVTACKRDNLDIICVVLGADTKNFRTQDSTKLIEYTYKTYQMLDVENIINEAFSKWKQDNLSSFNISKAISNNLNPEIKNRNFKYYPVKKEDINNIKTSIECEYNLVSPLESGSKIGTIFVNIDNTSVLNYDIVNTNKIEKKNCFNYTIEFLSKFFYYLTICY